MNEEDEQIFHIRFNAEERGILQRMKELYGSSLTAAVRACVRAMGRHFDKQLQQNDIQKGL